MYVHSFTTSENVVKDLAETLTAGDTLDASNNWALVYPVGGIGSVTNEVVLQVSPEKRGIWVKKEPQTVASGGVITVNHDIAPDANCRLYVRDKKYYLYRQNDDSVSLDIMEYRISGSNTLEVHSSLVGKEVLVNYEKDETIVSGYFVRLNKPATTSAGGDNHFFIEWQIGDAYDPSSNTFSEDHHSEVGKINWFKETENASLIGRPWLPIEYWISFDKNAAAGVIMGDPGLSVDNWLSAPFYFGSASQIDGALETDIKGNFGGFGGSFSPPVLTKTYGDYTGTGITDVIMAYTKTGRPYQAHKMSLFGGYEFREKTFNGQSAHTGKHPVSDIVLTDVHENDRGTLRHCLAVPKVAKSHGTELIYKRYESGVEETYIFLHINTPYTPIQTSPDVLMGFAIRIDI